MAGKVLIDVVIPAYNEEQAIGRVIRDIPSPKVREVVVVSNGSTDATEEHARREGATVLQEPNRGYGYACLKGIAYLREKGQTSPEILVFMDGDYSDYPEELVDLIRPIEEEGYDMVIGSRVLGDRQPGSLTLPQIFGNWLATRLIRWIYGERFTDLGPFRAIRFDKLLEMEMEDKTYGWTVEMQVKAARMGLKCVEIPVNYRPRIGVSKVSGTVKGTILAGYKILWTIFKLL